MVRITGVVLWWDHYWLYMMVVKMHRPVMVMVHHRYWYRTNHWY
jgi:hypothetical protein